ncbi:hypothetical protein A8B78_22135 [Jannaschia sp. EhC01]|nr:hypothetical protein A8B78_22135 [Jannaschia sp. EhC01]
MNIKTYFASENGAISVDWVVITSGLVGLGLATAGVVSGGVEGASNNISNALIGQDVSTAFQSAFVAATAALTATSVWDDPTATSREFANVEQLSFSSEIDFQTTDEGIIFESGGTGRGFILYQHDGMLYLQAGDGSGTGPASNRGEASWQVTEGTYTIEGSMDADNGLALYVNGTLVDESSFTNRDLSGSNHGSVGGGTSSVARNRGNFNAASEGHPGVTEVAFYEDQTIQ